MTLDHYDARSVPPAPGPPSAAERGADVDPAVEESAPPASRFLAGRLGRRSLTARLVAGVVVLVVFVVAVVGAATYFALRTFVYNKLDQQLTSVADGNQVYFNNCIVSEKCSNDGPAGGFRSPQIEWIGVLAPTGQQIYSPADLDPNSVRLIKLGSGQRSQLVHNPGVVFSMTGQDGKPLRLTSRELDVGGGLYVVSGLDSGQLTSTLNRLVLLEASIGLAAVAVALAATSWGVRRSLHNLYQVTGTAREVAAELSPSGAGLDRRVPVAEEGTEVGALAESMNTLLAAVETQFAARLESERRMRQFLADASHELRTPLTSIRGYAELARMQRAAGGANTSDDNLDRIEFEGTRMSRLVDDLLMLARGTSADSVRPAERLPVDVTGVVDDAVSGSRAAFGDRPIDTELAAVPDVLGDRDQLLRVIRNLITNAAVHTDAGRPILVRAAPDSGGVIVQVVDGGPGLPPEEAAHVFERFWRADKARTRARGGSGLGLAIVAAVVQAHQGTVRFDSDVQRGSTVTVWLPAAH